MMVVPLARFITTEASGGFTILDGSTSPAEVVVLVPFDTSKVCFREIALARAESLCRLFNGLDKPALAHAGFRP